MDPFRGFDTHSEYSSRTGKSTNQKHFNKMPTLSNYQEYLEYFDYMDETKIIYFLFTSTDSSMSGYSWSQICTETREVLEKRLEDQADCIFVTVLVGSQDEWEDPSNPYRTDEMLQLRVLPTFMNFESGKRLEGTYCLKSELLDQVIEQECDF